MGAVTLITAERGVGEPQNYREGCSVESNRPARTKRPADLRLDHAPHERNV